MKVLQRGLKKEEIAQVKRYQKWYKVVDNELRLFVNDSLKTKEDAVINQVDYKNNKAYLCMDNLEYSEKFYNKNKDFKIRLYIKSDFGSLYNEYDVKGWTLGNKGLELDLV